MAEPQLKVAEIRNLEIGENLFQASSRMWSGLLAQQKRSVDASERAAAEMIGTRTDVAETLMRLEASIDQVTAAHGETHKVIVQAVRKSAETRQAAPAAQPHDIQKALADLAGQVKGFKQAVANDTVDKLEGVTNAIGDLKTDISNLNGAVTHERTGLAAVRDRLDETYRSIPDEMSKVERWALRACVALAGVGGLISIFKAIV